MAGLLGPAFAGTASGGTTKARSPAMRSVSRLVTRTFEPLPAAMSSGHRRRRADDLFEVVQDQQQWPLVQSIDEALEERLSPASWTLRPRQWRAPPGPGRAARPG